ncbi:MAG: PEP-CTERM sorting domain-containing protein [Opitutales bacterium]|nr:PEP-CTERM sorting domain-containing protein [Opitutales bacterium]
MIVSLYGLTAYPIPEPSVFGLLAGVFALALGVSRRRRK